MRNISFSVLLIAGLLFGLFGQVNPASAQGVAGIPPSYQRVAENADFQLFADPTTLAFKVLDKRSGYVWHSNLDEVTEEDKLNRTWTAFARSGISIDYLDAKATPRRASITNAEHSIDFQPVADGFEAALTFSDVAISLRVIVKLGPAGVSVDVPFDSIKEGDPKFHLGNLHAYPFFGATREDSVPGYMFIPDGSGSLIRFRAATKAKNMFYGRYYGPDLGMLTSLPYDPTARRAYKISIPVIGMAHGDPTGTSRGQNAYLAVVEKGASYGEIQAHPAGITTRFNFLYSAFIYNQSYFQPTNRSGAGVTTLQAQPNAFDVRIHYRFLTGPQADYAGMARSYQQYLLDKGVLGRGGSMWPPNGDTNTNIGIRLEFLGAEKEKVLLWERSIPMTTLAQMAGIVDALEVRRPQVILYGWQPLGASAMPPTSLQLDGALGSVSQLERFSADLAARGGSLSLYLDPQAAIKDESGYSARYDLAMSITGPNLEGFNRGKPSYYFTLDALSRRLRGLDADMSQKLEAGLALDGIGSTLYSDFREGGVLNREQAIQAYQSLLTESKSRLAFYTPADYAFGFMTAYYDLPITDSGYAYTDDVVPFLQIALAGYVPMYGPALNFSSDLQEDILRHADFGVYPSYFLTQEATGNILKTRSNWIFTSSFAQWGDEIEQTYQWLNRLLGPVMGQRVVAREMLAEGVAATTYENDMQIIVNYSLTPFEADGVRVNARDAVIRPVGD
jgi:hypothetical protein